MSTSASILAACAVLAIAAATAPAQTPDPAAWMMKNYRFAGPPPPGSIPPVDPVVADLREIQNTLMSILRKADYAEDYETAYFIAGQATANAQLIGSINQRLAAAAKAEQARVSVPLYAIALKDHTILDAIAYWADGPMLHYVTPQGIHVQMQLDLVDRDLSARVNRARNLEFHLPE
jgi:hypothetical protein